MHIDLKSIIWNRLRGKRGRGVCFEGVNLRVGSELKSIQICAGNL